MVIFIRKQNRVLLNLPHIVTTCRRAGFAPHVMNLRRQTPLPAIHAALASADAMVAVHGAAITHFLFVRPGSVLLQIVPVGLDWAADAFYSKPAQQLGLEYLEYKVAPEESSLGVNSTVVRDPSVISSRGWWEMKKLFWLGWGSIIKGKREILYIELDWLVGIGRLRAQCIRSVHVIRRKKKKNLWWGLS